MKDKRDQTRKNFMDILAEGKKEYMVKSYEFRMKFAEQKAFSLGNGANRSDDFQ